MCLAVESMAVEWGWSWQPSVARQCFLDVHGPALFGEKARKTVKEDTSLLYFSVVPLTISLQCCLGSNKTHPQRNYSKPVWLTFLLRNLKGEECWLLFTIVNESEWGIKLNINVVHTNYTLFCLKILFEKQRNLSQKHLKRWCLDTSVASKCNFVKLF